MSLSIAMDKLLTCCLDTSAVNSLLDDPDRNKLLANIGGKYQVLPTSINVVEIVSTEDPHRRRAPPASSAVHNRKSAASGDAE